MIYEWFTEFTKKMKVNLFAYDYQGYGKAQGTPSEQKCYDNIDAAFEYLITQRRMSPESIVLYGRSLGSGPSTYLAEKLSKIGVSIGGLVLQSALLSVYRVAFYFRFTMWGDSFPNLDRIQNVACPVFIIHGTRDEIVPFWNGEELFLHAPIEWRACPYWVEQAGHNNIETSFKEDNLFFKRFLEFLQDHVEEYSRRPGAADRSGGGLEMPMGGMLPRPPRAGAAGVQSVHHLSAAEGLDTSMDSSSNALLATGSYSSTGGYSGSSSNLSSSCSDGSLDEAAFPVVVGNIDSSLHGGQGGYVQAHDIVLEGISDEQKTIEMAELGQEFDQHFGLDQHNTI